MLSSDDPVRVFQDFATLDLLSGGRAEIMAGRGSFIESFPLFGYDLDDYDELFAEKLELLLKLREAEHVTWPGGTAAARRARRLPAPGAGPAAGVDRRRRHAAVGGRAPARSACRWRSRSSAGSPSASCRSSSSIAAPRAQAGHDRALPVSINSHGFIADTRSEAADECVPRRTPR